MEHLAFAERHVPAGRLLVVEMHSIKKKKQKGIKKVLALTPYTKKKKKKRRQLDGSACKSKNNNNNHAAVAYLKLRVERIRQRDGWMVLVSLMPLQERAETRDLLDVEGIAVSGSNDLVVLVALVLHYQFDLVLQTEKEEDGFFARHTSHIHVVHFENLVSRHETLEGRSAAWLNGSHEDANLITTRHSNAN